MGRGHLRFISGYYLQQHQQNNHVMYNIQSIFNSHSLSLVLKVPCFPAVEFLIVRASYVIRWSPSQLLSSCFLDTRRKREHVYVLPNLFRHYQHTRQDSSR